jgi:uncharacterized protein YggE
MYKEYMNNTTLLQKAGVFALGSVGVLALSGVWFIYKGISQSDERTFNVQGKGEIEVKATKATISADIVSDSKDMKDGGESVKNLSEMTKKIFAELKAAGVKEEDIKTQNVSTNPKYDYCYNYVNQRYNLPDYCKNNPNDPKIIGFTSSQTITVKIEDNKELVEKVLGLLPSLGARSVNGPAWEVDNKKAIQEARELAVKEAREKAEGIAKSLGMSLGEVKYYNESQGGNAPVPMMFAKDMAMSARVESAGAVSIPVSEGTDKVTVNVDITYELR